MRANPGGDIIPTEVVGRDRLIQQLWRTLERQSVILIAERRMGKSCVIKKMVAEKPENIIACYRDVENIETPLEFIERIYQDIHPHLKAIKKTASNFQKLLKKLSGAQISGLGTLPQAATEHWKTLLESILRDLLSDHTEPVLLFWDEFPLMLQKIGRSSGEAVVMDILDTLRQLRQTHSNLRMLYTGSIGLHHVIAALRRAGHANDATNDMRTVEVAPLSSTDGEWLANELMKGEQLDNQDADTAAIISSSVDHIAFYIHYVVSEMKYLGDTANVQLGKQIVAQALTDRQDPWHLHHYRERLDGYFKNRLPVALAILDELVTNRLDFQTLFERISSNTELDDEIRKIASSKEAVRTILVQLQRDHYIEQVPDTTTYQFHFPLIQRWWRLRGNA